MVNDSDKRLKAALLGNKSLLLASLDDIELAEEINSEVLELFRELEDSSGLLKCACELGGLYMRREKYDKAEEMYRLVIALSIKYKNTTSITIAIGNLAILQDKQGLSKEALSTYQTAIKMCEHLADAQTLAYSVTNYSVFLLRSGDHNAAREALERAHALNMQLGRVEQVVYCTRHLYQIYSRAGQVSKADLLCNATQEYLESAGAAESAALLRDQPDV